MEDKVLSDEKSYGTFLHKGIVVVSREQDGKQVFTGKLNLKEIENITVDKAKIILEEVSKTREEVDSRLSECENFLKTFIDNFMSRYEDSREVK